MKKSVPPFRTVLNVDESIPAECNAVVTFDHHSGTASVARNARCSIKHECNVDDVFFSSEKEFDLWHDVLKTATKELWDGENISLILHGPAQNMSLFSGASSSSVSSSASPSNEGGKKTKRREKKEDGTQEVAAADDDEPSSPTSPIATKEEDGGRRATGRFDDSPPPAAGGAGGSVGGSLPDTALNKILRALLQETKFREVPQHYKASVCVGSMLMDVHGAVSDVGATFEGALTDGDGDAVLDGYGETHRMLMFPVTHEEQLVDFSSKLSSVCQPVMMSTSDGPMLLISVKLIQQCSISPTRASYIRIVQLVNSPHAMEETMLAVAKTKSLPPMASNISKAALDRISGSSQVVFVQSTTPDRAVEVLPIIAAGKGTVVRTELNNATTDVVAASHTFVLRRHELREQLRELKQEVKELKLKYKQQQMVLQRAQQEANSSPTGSPTHPISVGGDHPSPDGAATNTSAGDFGTSVLLASPSAGCIRSGTTTPRRGTGLGTISPCPEDEKTIKLEEMHFKFQQQAQITRRKLLGRISQAQEELNTLSSTTIELRKSIGRARQALEQDKMTYAESLNLLRKEGEASLKEIQNRPASGAAAALTSPLTALSFLKTPTKSHGNVSVQLPTLRVRSATPESTAAQLRELIQEEQQHIARSEAEAAQLSQEITAEVAQYRYHVCALLENCRSLRTIYQKVEPVAMATSSYLTVDVPKGHGLVTGIAGDLIRACVSRDMSITPEQARFIIM